jgi:hypothetical protein
MQDSTDISELFADIHADIGPYSDPASDPPCTAEVEDEITEQDIIISGLNELQVQSPEEFDTGFRSVFNDITEDAKGSLAKSTRRQYTAYVPVFIFSIISNNERKQ